MNTHSNDVESTCGNYCLLAYWSVVLVRDLSLSLSLSNAQILRLEIGPQINLESKIMTRYDSFTSFLQNHKLNIIKVRCLREVKSNYDLLKHFYRDMVHFKIIVIKQIATSVIKVRKNFSKHLYFVTRKEQQIYLENTICNSSAVTRSKFLGGDKASCFIRIRFGIFQNPFVLTT